MTREQFIDFVVGFIDEMYDTMCSYYQPYVSEMDEFIKYYIKKHLSDLNPGHWNPDNPLLYSGEDLFSYYYDTYHGYDSNDNYEIYVTEHNDDMLLGETDSEYKQLSDLPDYIGRNPLGLWIYEELQSRINDLLDNKE